MTNTYGLYSSTKKTSQTLGYFKPIDIPYDDTDVIITIAPEYQHRPRKLANDLYGQPELYWIFRTFNKEKIQDPIFDLKEGISIIIPEKNRLLSYF